MAATSIEFNADKAEALLKQYPRKTQTATMRALNRALTTGRAEMARLVGKDMGLKVGDAKDAIVVTEATRNTLAVRLAASKRRLPLSEFKAKDQRPRGVSYRIGTGGRGRVPNAFIAKVHGPLPSGVVSSGHTGVFVRQGKKRLPIRQLYGPSVGHVFAKYRDQVIAKMREAFEARLTHELRFAETEKT